MRTGVMNRLSQWEKGQFAGGSAADVAKAKVI